MIHPYYEWEWLSDLAIIPAFEIFAIGFILGCLTIGLILRWDRKEEIKSSNLQLIETLCVVVEQLIVIVRQLSEKLEQINALDEADRKAVNDAIGKYEKTLGSVEIDDEKAISGIMTED